MTMGNQWSSHVKDLLVNPEIISACQPVACEEGDAISAKLWYKRRSLRVIQPAGCANKARLGIGATFGDMAVGQK